jgi:hypothetical protein
VSKQEIKFIVLGSCSRISLWFRIKDEYNKRESSLPNDSKSGIASLLNLGEFENK